jgi:uncharacterized protein (TIRG00374 family)
VTTRQRRLLFFVGTETRRRRRRSSDVVATVCTALILICAVQIAEPLSAAEQAIIELAAAMPGFLEVVWQMAAALLGIWAATIVVAGLVQRRGALLVDVAIGMGLATALWWWIDRIVGDLQGAGRVPVLLSIGAVAVGCARPHLGRPYQRIGRWLVITAAIAAVILGTTTPTGAVTAVLIAVTSAGLSHLLLGTREGRPDLGLIAAALTTIGRPVGELVESPQQEAGVFIVEGVADGRQVVAKVFGRDARDTQLMAKAWRSLWYRETASVMPTRLQQAEHEAFVTMLAASRGVPVPSVVSVTRTPSHDAVLVLEDVDEPIRQLDTSTAGAMWDLLDRVHRAGLALRDVSISRFGTDAEGRIGLGDLSTTGLSGPDEGPLDRTQLLVATAQHLGIDAATRVATEHLGHDAMAALVPYVQSAALGPTLRSELHGVDDLRDHVAELSGVESPELAELRRVSPASLVRMALMTFAAYAIITLLGGVDPDELVAMLSGAALGWVALALVVGQLPVLTETVSTQGASTRRLAVGPLVALQSAIGFVKLAVPSTAGRMAMIVRYFQKQGVPPAEALSISAIETFSGFVIQIVVLVLTLVVGIGSVSLDLSADTTGATFDLTAALLIVAVIAVAAVIVVLAWPPLRHRLLDRVRPWLHQARSSTDVLRSPTRVVELLGGNLLSQLLFAGALAACVRAFGVEVNLGEALVVYVIASLFGGFMPVPGGIGVMEAALTVGLVAAGVDESVALGAAITFRIVTFYVPPIWGWAAFRWLERNTYL